MKKTAAVLIILASLNFFSCNTGGKGASNPNKTDEEFQNPTGDLNDQNAQSVIQSGINGTKIIPLQSPEELFDFDDLDIEGCSSFGSFSTEIDWGCAFEDVDDCTASGNTISTDDPDLDFVTIDYNDLSADCTGGIEFSCDGQINVSKISDASFCANLTHALNNETLDFNGCRNDAGDYSVRVDDHTFVISEFSIDPDCSTLTATVQDKNGTQTVECTISDSAPCNEPAEIVAINNCEMI